MRDETILNWFIGIIVAIALLAIAYLVFSANKPRPHDDTDPLNGYSGMSLHTDAKTGCQYLGIGSSITPRLDASGKQICIHPAEGG